MRSVELAAEYVDWLKEQKTSRVFLVVGSVVLSALLAIMFFFGLVRDIQARGSFPEGVSICGVDVGGLNKAEALAECRRELDELSGRPLSFKIDNEVYRVTPESIGLKLPHKRMVEEAYGRAWDVNPLERVARRLLGRPRKIDTGVVTEYDEGLLRASVEVAKSCIDRPPRDAYIDVSSGSAVIVPAREGRRADLNQLITQAREALTREDRTVTPRVERTPAAVTDEGFGKFILVNLGSHTLSLYNRDQLLASYPVAVGSPEWPTVIGQWAIVRKEKNPTWHNRGSAWMENMPPMIPPGPNNPLGTRALHLNGGGVLIHGTTNTWSIGRSVSHGCIRMYMRDVEALFDQVEVGTPVYIIKASGDPGFDCSKKPFWME